jgi:Myo-inositol-1-phosphate synthase
LTSENVRIAPADGKLGILIPGIGAVSTTLMAGVEAVKRGLGQLIGSLTQLAAIRLGKRTEGRTSRIKDFVPLAKLDDLVFGGWRRERGLGQHRHFRLARIPDADQDRLPVPRLDSGGAPRARSRSLHGFGAALGMRGIQEWLSFYFKAPMTAPSLYPEHDILFSS